MASTTYKDVTCERTDEGTDVSIHEQDVTSAQGYTEWSRTKPVRHDLGRYDRLTADWISSRLKQRFPNLSEPLTEQEVESIRQQIVDRLL
jgi:hypothetical protein